MSAIEGVREPGRRVYLDTASGEALHPAARAVYQAALDTAYADPRRLHRRGAATARLVLDNARAVTGRGAGADGPTRSPSPPSGTDGVHRGAARPAPRGRRVPGDTAASHTAVEHSAVLHAAGLDAGPRRRGRAGRPDGRVDLRRPRPRPDAAVAWPASPPTTRSAPSSRSPRSAAPLDGVPLFVDACASAGRLPLPQGWSALAASAHKWGGPAGRRRPGRAPGRPVARARPRTTSASRSATTGFENVPAVAGRRRRAAGRGRGARPRSNARQRALVDRIRRRGRRHPGRRGGRRPGATGSRTW